MPHVSSNLMLEYLGERGIVPTTMDSPSDCDIADVIISAVLKAPKPKRDTVLEELEELEENVDDGFVTTLMTTARLMRLCIPLEGVFHKLCSNRERALWTLVHHRRVYEASLQFDETADLKYYRRKMPRIEVCLDDAKVKSLAVALSKISKDSGSGKGVEPRAYQIGNISLLVFYLENPQRKDPNFNAKSEFGYITRRPAYEVVFRYDPTEPALRTYVKGKTPAFRRDVEAAFAQMMLGIELPPDSEIGRYNLSRFLKEGGAMFDFSDTPDVEKVSITRIRLQYFDHTIDDSVLSFLHTAAPQNVDKVIQKAIGIGGEDNDEAQVAEIRLRVEFNDGLRRRKPSVSFDITPDTCTLTDKKRHHVLKGLLKKWEIDEQTDTADHIDPAEKFTQRILQLSSPDAI
jgi:hypothetical protein